MNVVDQINIFRTHLSLRCMLERQQAPSYTSNEINVIYLFHCNNEVHNGELRFHFVREHNSDSRTIALLGITVV